MTWDRGMMVENVKECRILNIWSDLTLQPPNPPTGQKAPVIVGRGAGINITMRRNDHSGLTKRDFESSTSYVGFTFDDISANHFNKSAKHSFPASVHLIEWFALSLIKIAREISMYYGMTES